MDYYKEIKNELIHNETNRLVKECSIHKSDLTTYYNVGKMLSDAGKHYGEGIINKYSIKLIHEVDKKYNVTNLKRYRQFYYMIEKGAPMGHQLTWSHYRELLPIKDIDKIKYYINQTIRRNLTKRQLADIIKNKEYERLPEGTRNSLAASDNSKIDDYIKNPIIIKNTSNYDYISEKVLQKLILEDISSFMRELGEGFSFIGNEYKIKIGDQYNYIDLLLFNIQYNCYVVLELKVSELKKEYIGQISTYMNYIDRNLKRMDQDKTIGIIIVKKDNCFIMEYCSDSRILRTTYLIV